MKKSPSILVQLVHLHGPMKGEIQEFPEGLISIGRLSSCTLRFPADMTNISRKHAEIRREGNQFKLTDFSANGTFLNGKRVKESFLKDGDVLEIAEGGPKVSFLTRVTEAAAEYDTNRSYQETPRERSEDIPPADGNCLESPRLPKIGSIDEAQPVAAVVADIHAPKAKVPLIIQFGPTIRSYKELPITIGKNPKCDFVLSHPAILDHHAQILFGQNQYWIKDLSGRNLVLLNNRSIEFQAPLNLDDHISLSPQGPVFCFLGQGRLAEVAQPSPAAPPGQEEKEHPGKDTGASREKASRNFWSKLKKP
jgi:pSer/pThr/pTyr-binding forkhead associated (FHA) protein